MNTPVFRPLFRASWDSIWRSPWLLLFGFFAAMLGMGGVGELLFNSTQSGRAAAATFLALLSAVREGLITNVVRGLFLSLQDDPLSLFFTLLILFVVVAVLIVFFWLAALGQGAVIDTASKSALRLRTTARAAWAVGRRFSIRFIGVYLSVKIGIAFAFFCFGLLMNAMPDRGLLSTVLSFFLFVILTALSLAAVLLVRYAGAAIVIRGFSFKEALRTALQLSLRHWLISLELAAIFFLLSFVFLAVLLLLVLILTVPFAFLFLILSILSFPNGMWAVVVLWIFVAALLLAFVASFFTVLQTNAWTFLFLRLTGDGATSKLLRLFHKNIKI